MKSDKNDPYTTRNVEDEIKLSSCIVVLAECFLSLLTQAWFWALLVILGVFFFYGEQTHKLLFGSVVTFPIALAHGWKFPGFCNNDIPEREGVCNLNHEGRCAGLTQCIQTDVDDCRHVCEIAIFCFRDKKREDSADPKWTIPIQEVKCATKSCGVMVPYTGDIGDPLYCWECENARVYDEGERFPDQRSPRWVKCVACKKVEVDANDGMDTCVICLRRA